MTPSVTTTYSVASMTDALLCAGSGSGTATVTVNARPGTPVILAPDTVLSERAGYAASIPAVSGVTYAWTITGGAITAGGTTPSITFTSGTKGPLTLSAKVTSGSGCASEPGTKTVTVLPVLLYTVPPCRVIDTRDISAPALSEGQWRRFGVGGNCGVSATARVIVLNVTVVGPTAAGYLTLFPGDAAMVPLASTINFRPGQVRANNAVVPLGADGTLGILNGSLGSTHVIVDVVGYFE